MAATSSTSHYDSALSRFLSVELIYEGEGYRQYAVKGHQTIKQALVPEEINAGEMFQIRNLDGSTSIAVWLGTLRDSLGILQYL